MGIIFSFQASYGPWNAENFLVYLFIGYIFILTVKIVNLGSRFRIEKYWGTLQALMVAPFNKFNLLIGMVLTHLIEISIPFIIFLIIIYVIFTISIFTLMFVILLFLGVLMIFAGIGFFIGVFVLSKESVATWFGTLLGFFFLFACISYPYQIFPEYIQRIVALNPVYYIIDIIRLAWIEDNVLVTLLNHPYHLIIYFALLIICPYLGVSMFNYIFKKYGIEGY